MGFEHKDFKPTFKDLPSRQELEEIGEIDDMPILDMENSDSSEDDEIDEFRIINQIISMVHAVPPRRRLPIGARLPYNQMLPTIEETSEEYYIEDEAFEYDGDYKDEDEDEDEDEDNINIEADESIIDISTLFEQRADKVTEIYFLIENYIDHEDEADDVNLASLFEERNVSENTNNTTTVTSVLNETSACNTNITANVHNAVDKSKAE